MPVVLRRVATLVLVIVCACGRPAPPPPPPPPVLAPPADVINSAPAVAVSGNALAGNVTYGAELALTATCTDREDGRIAAIRWSTDSGVALGEGSVLRLMPEPGEYVVLATCTDRGGRATTVAATARFSVVDRWTSGDSIPITVRLPFVTDRGGRVLPRTPQRSFSGTPRDALVRGMMSVNVPARDFRQAGTASRTPFMRSTRGNFAAADAERLAFRTIESVDSAAFRSSLDRGLAEAPGGEVLVFIHGFNTSFEGAATRAARLAAELQYPGVVVLYSWPSDGELSSYRSDQRDAQASGPHLARFLLELQAAAGARRLSLVAHSMGSEVLASALREVASWGRQPRMATAARALRLGDVVLVSPDIAADEFVGTLLPSLRTRAERITLYASSADFALWSSWGSNRERRLGMGGRFATVAQGMETVEVPYEATDAIGHNPFLAERFRDDLHLLLVQHLSADRRSLITLQRDDGRSSWRMP